MVCNSRQQFKIIILNLGKKVFFESLYDGHKSIKLYRETVG